MNLISICVLALATAVIAVMLKPKNGEIAVMLVISCGVIMLTAVFSQASEVITTVNRIIAASGISTGYVVILLKVVGICLITEFTVNTCKDCGSQTLAGNVLLAGKIMVTLTALPLYSDILNTVLSIAGG